MSFPQPGDFNTYQGTVLKLIARTVVDLQVDYHVTELYGSKDSSCTTEVKDTLNSITFPANSKLVTIQNYAFYECKKIMEVDLSPCKELRTIDSYAFCLCSSLSKIIFPIENLVTIGDYSFKSSGVVNVFIPSKVSHFGFAAFQFCTKMETLEFDPESQVLALTKHLLSNSLVKTFTIRKNVKSVNQGAFEKASNLLTINVDEGNTNYVIELGGLMNIAKTDFITIPLGLTGEYSVPNGTKIVCSPAFINCKLTKVILPEGLLTVDWCAFSTSTQLEEVVFSDSITFIGASAFNGCSALKSIDLPKNLTKIDKGAFYGCKFPSVVIPEGVTTIEANCFQGNENLLNVVLPSTITNLGGSVFPENKGIIISFGHNSTLKITTSFIIMDKNETFISQYMGSEENFIPVIPSTVKTINSGAFQSKKNLIGLDFTGDSQLIEIGSSAFLGCTNLKDVVFPTTLRIIGENAFNGCENIVEISLKSNVDKIFNNAFANCKKLQTADLQSTKITNLEGSLFASCVSLETVHLPPNELSFGKNCFSKCSALTTIDIPTGASITEIGDGAFSETSLSSFTFPETSTVTEISRYAFYKCTKLTSFTFINTIQTIGYCAYAFTGLTSLTLSDSITQLNEKCFSSCPNLVSFTIPQNSKLTETGLSLGIFSNSTSFSNIICDSQNFEVSIGALFTKDLTKILIFPSASDINCLPIPQSVQTIGNGAFINCYNLYSVIISKKSVHTIGNNAFEGCTNLHYINIPGDVKSVGDCAFKGCKSLFCGLDIESKDPVFLENLFKVGKVPRNALRECNKITCNNCRFQTFGLKFFIGFSLFISA